MVRPFGLDTSSVPGYPLRPPPAPSPDVTTNHPNWPKSSVAIL